MTDFDNAWQAYQWALLRAEQQAALLGLAELRRAKVVELLDLGDTDRLEVLDVELAWVEAKAEAVRAHYDAALAFYTVKQLAGQLDQDLIVAHSQGVLEGG